MSNHDDLKLLEALAAARKRLLAQLRKVIVGQEHVLEDLLVGLFAGGHCLLEGPPGLAKTLMVRTLASCLSLTFKRIQFTPDVMPADITGADVLQENRATGERSFTFQPGPLFAQIILADEINRAPPKTQSALLEAMQERQVTASGTTYPLPQPMFVLATQNPIEQEGVYPLPEAQLDRFMLKIHVDYPSEQEEVDIVRRTTGDVSASVEPVLSAEEVIAFQHLVRRIPAPETLVQTAVDLVRRSRPQNDKALDRVKRFVAWGAGPRAAQSLILAAKARAALSGRPALGADDLKSAALAVMRHRIVRNFDADAEGLANDELVRELLSTSGLSNGRGGNDRDLAFVRSKNTR